MTTRRTTTLLASAAIVAGALALVPTTAGGQTPSCDQPYAPVAFAELYPAQETLPVVDAEVVSTFLVLDQSFDSDGDGVDDTRTQEPDGVRITRGDGDVVLTSPGGAFPVGVDDMDGDGRDEIAVQTAGDLYLVPGTVPTGTTPVADAGILLPFGAAEVRYLTDGSDRLLVRRPATNSLPEDITDVLDGSDVLAIGPGGDAGSLTPAVTVPGEVRFVADLGGPLVLVSGRSAADATADARIELFVVDGTAIVELTTLPERYQPEYASPYGGVEVLDGPDGTFVTLVQSSRNGSASYMWSLDDPCTSLEVADPTTTTTTTPAATPAAPVAAEAQFTG
ncbi:MAG TPA: hypothetical protein VK507_03460 [Iamia sp.]|nr:hypothetical protein [Iamia sp.]